MAEKEIIYTIPLRKEFQKAPNYKKTSKAVRALKSYLLKHTKAEQVKIGPYLNKEMWKHGRKNPPSKIQVKVIKEDNIAKAELIGAPIEVKEEKKKSIKEKLTEKVKGKEKLEEKVGEKKEVKVPEKKPKKEKKLDMSLQKNIKKVSKEQTKKAKEKTKES
jgi:large subunit ribosomal protein L31e